MKWLALIAVLAITGCVVDRGYDPVSGQLVFRSDRFCQNSSIAKIVVIVHTPTTREVVVIRGVASGPDDQAVSALTGFGADVAALILKALAIL